MFPIDSHYLYIQVKCILVEYVYQDMPNHFTISVFQRMGFHFPVPPSVQRRTQRYIYIYIYLTAIGFYPGGSGTIRIQQTTNRIQQTTNRIQQI
jgi:hypothetical protein